MRLIGVGILGGVLVLLVFLAAQAGYVTPLPPTPPPSATDARVTSATIGLNTWFRQRWAQEDIQPAELADELTVFRRLSLALHGSIPSLAEIRSFEQDHGPDRLQRWTEQLLHDPRYADYFGERLARSLVGTEEGPFIVYRRDQLRLWITRQLQADTPWTEMTRQLIAADGLWTDSPATNFITVAQVPDEGINVNKLAGRTVRTFLGQRIDCAQCHDHPFDPEWQQTEFEGLAAWYCQARVTVVGVTDRVMEGDQRVEYRIADPGSMAMMSSDDESEKPAGRLVLPAVPFHPEWVPTEGTYRERLARWVIHPDNRRYERAIANRIWGLMFGRPWSEPVDDLPHPSADGTNDVLDLLGREFRNGGGRLSTLIRVIASTDAFRLSSEADVTSEEDYDRMAKAWAVFPLIRLRPEQVIGSMFQASNVRTIDQNANVFIRFTRLIGENDFLNEYGDAGEDELQRQVGTIPQALLRMNGRFTRELTESGGLKGPAQLLLFSPDDPALVENCFLACLSRRPTPEELSFFLTPLEAGSQGRGADPVPGRSEVVTDIFWTLVNSPEFSWNY